MLRNSRPGDALRAKIRPSARHFLVLLSLVGVLSTQSGCRSGCSSCNIGSKITNGVQNLGARVFNRVGHGGGGGCSTCGDLGSPVAEEGVVIDSGLPISSPGSIVVPPPATVIQGGPSASEPPAIQLEPIPKGDVSPTGATSSSTTPPRATPASRASFQPGRSSIETSFSRQAARDEDRSSRVVLSSGVQLQPRLMLEPPELVDPSIPVDLPAEITRNASIGSIGPVGASSAQPSEFGIDRPRMSVEAPTEAVASTVVASTAPSAVVAPRESVVDDRFLTRITAKLSSGNLTTLDQVDLIRSRGFSSFVDLRPTGDIPQGLASGVEARGMSYVSMAIDPSAMTQGDLDRFEGQANGDGKGPIFFCDRDGSRIGLLWYCHLRNIDHEDAKVAAIEATNLGLRADSIGPADRLIDGLKQAQAVPVVASAVPVTPVALAEADPVDLTLPVSLPVEEAEARVEPTASTEIIRFSTPATQEPSSAPAEEESEAKSRSLLGDFGHSSWKPVTALLLGGLGFPIAYWSRSALLEKRIVRASLTSQAPEARKSLPSWDA